MTLVPSVYCYHSATAMRAVLHSCMSYLFVLRGGQPGLSPGLFAAVIPVASSVPGGTAAPNWSDSLDAIKPA